MFRISKWLVVLTLMVLAGCTSEEAYRSQVRNTQVMIEESALLCYDVCQQNQVRAIESSVIFQKTGKLFLTPELIDAITKDELETAWMQVEMQFVTLAYPPESCREEYEIMTKIYEAYQRLHQLAINPVGLVEHYQFTSDVLYELIGAKGIELSQLSTGE